MWPARAVLAVFTLCFSKHVQNRFPKYRQMSLNCPNSAIGFDKVT